MKKVGVAARTLLVWCGLVILVSRSPSLVTVLLVDRPALVVIAVLVRLC